MASNPVPNPLLPSLAETAKKTFDIRQLFFYLDQLNSNPALVDPEISDGSDDLTTTKSTIIKATGAMTITLNPAPVDREYVIVYHSAGNSVNVNVTDGTGTDVINTDQTVVSYLYVDALSEWIRGA